jgi:hypothetical protein
LFASSCSGIKTELLYFQKMISKRNQNFTNCTRVFQRQKKLFVVPKKFGNGPEQKLLDQIFLVLIENLLFRSRILFQKRIYPIFFGTKAAKRKLSILKEHWFDIASPCLHLMIVQFVILLWRSFNRVKIFNWNDNKSASRLYD